MSNTISEKTIWVEIILKFKYFYKKVLSAIYLIFIPTPGFRWSVVNENDLDHSLLSSEKLLKYEMDKRADNVFKLEYVGGSSQLRKLLLRMGFMVDTIWGASKYADMGAVLDLEIPKIYAPLWAVITKLFIFLPLPKINLFLPGLGRKRLHIRVFEEKTTGTYYITSHVDNTNPLSLSIKDKKEMYRSHILNKIDGDYRKGERLLFELFERYYPNQLLR